MKKTILAPFTTQEPDEEHRRMLDYELARRQRFPPCLSSGEMEQWVSLADLRTELAVTPVTHPEYEWRVWELALAERQQVHRPDSLFYRIVLLADARAVGR